MLDRAAIGPIKPISFLDHYRQKHDNMLPPSITRRLPFEHIELPKIDQLQEHLESIDGAAWAQTWGRKIFFDKTPRLVGVREREMREYVYQLWLKEKVAVHEVPVHYNEVGERKDGYVAIAAKHVTQWGRPVAKFWFLGPQLAEVRLEFQKEPRREEEIPEPHPRIIRRPEVFKRRQVSEPVAY